MDYSNLPGMSWNSLRKLFFGNENRLEDDLQPAPTQTSELFGQGHLSTSANPIEDTKVFSAMAEMSINDILINEGLVLKPRDCSDAEERFASLEAQIPAKGWSIGKHRAENAFNRLAARRRAQFESEQTET